MKRLGMFLMAAALMTGGSALATAQPFEHDGRRDGDRDRFERRYDRDDYRFRDRDDHRFRDRDDRRFVVRNDYRFHDRDDYRVAVGERRFFNGYYWTWDGSRWCRRNNGITLYFGF
jgi:hypothetical protein